MRSGIRLYLIAAAVAACTAPSVVVAQEKDRLVEPPVSRMIEPLEQIASTAEILTGIEACRLALGEDGKFDEVVFQSLHWRRGATYRDASSDLRTEYYNRNLVNDILTLDRIDSCFTKAKISSRAQMAEVLELASTTYEMHPLDSRTALAEQMVARFGEDSKDNVLVGDRFLLLLEPTARGADTYVSITFVPLKSAAT